MKFSITTSAAILAMALCLGWRDEGRLTAARDRNASLAAEVKKAGIQFDPLHPGRTTKRHRDEKSVDVQRLADGLIALYAKDEASRTHEEMVLLGGYFDSLDAAGFRELLAKLKATTTADEKSRAASSGLAIYRFSMRFPQATLEFLAGSPDVLETGNPQKKNAINIAISSWGAENPGAALSWYQENKSKSADFTQEGTSGFLLSGIARTDPRKAFGLLAEPGIGGESAGSITRWAAPENRQAALAGLREYAAGLADPKAGEEVLEQGLKWLSQAVSQQDFETAAKWLDAAKLTPAERKIFAKNRMDDNFQPADTGRWIEWTATALPAGEADSKISGFVNRWAENDYAAVAAWLGATPEGPAKTISIRAYAETVSSYDPETAAQWAMTLPAGGPRDETLRKIYQKWPKGDPASRDAAEAFKDKHGIR